MKNEKTINLLKPQPGLSNYVKTANLLKPHLAHAMICRYSSCLKHNSALAHQGAAQSSLPMGAAFLSSCAPEPLAPVLTESITACDDRPSGQRQETKNPDMTRLLTLALPQSTLPSDLQENRARIAQTGRFAAHDHCLTQAAHCSATHRGFMCHG